MRSSPAARTATARPAPSRAEQLRRSTATSSTPTVPSCSTPKACRHSNPPFPAVQSKGRLAAPFLFSVRGGELLHHRVERAVQPLVKGERLTVDLRERGEVLRYHHQVNAVEKGGVAIERAEVLRHQDEERLAAVDRRQRHDR